MFVWLVIIRSKQKHVTSLLLAVNKKNIFVASIREFSPFLPGENGFTGAHGGTERDGKEPHFGVKNVWDTRPLKYHKKHEIAIEERGHSKICIYICYS